MLLPTPDSDKQRRDRWLMHFAQHLVIVDQMSADLDCPSAAELGTGLPGVAESLPAAVAAIQAALRDLEPVTESIPF